MNEETIIKLAIIQSLCNLLAEIDFEIVDGAESRLEMHSGDVFVISVKRESEDDSDRIEFDDEDHRVV